MLHMKHAHNGIAEEKNTTNHSAAAVSKAMRDALTSSSQIQSTYHSGVRNMFLVSSIGFALAAFLLASRVQGVSRMVLSVLIAAIFVYSSTYGMCVARWHRGASAILEAALELDEVVPAPVSRMAIGMIRNSWETRVKAYAAIEMVALIAILAVIFFTLDRKS